MTLKYMAGRAVLHEIEKSSVNDLLLSDRSNAPVLKALYDSGAIREKDFMHSLEQAIFNDVREGINVLKRPNPTYRIPVDMSCNPSYLVYAISQNVLSEEEIKIIKDRLGGSGKLEDFVKEHTSSNVLESLRERLLNPKPLEFSGSGDSTDHCACSP